jgi:hypothetical protein
MIIIWNIFDSSLYTVNHEIFRSILFGNLGQIANLIQDFIANAAFYVFKNRQMANF